MSDIWAAYANIDTIDNRVYLHSFINHSQNFVHPIDQEIHTQTIENMWMRAKRKLKRQFGTSEELFSIYRRATTLEAEIWEYIKPGSHIMSDIWAAYANIDTIDNRVYLHSFINHSQNFVHPIDQEIHTQTIENMWMRAKRN